MNIDDIELAQKLKEEIKVAQNKLKVIDKYDLQYVEVGNTSIRKEFLTESTMKSVLVLVKTDLQIYLADREQRIANL